MRISRWNERPELLKARNVSVFRREIQCFDVIADFVIAVNVLTL